MLKKRKNEELDIAKINDSVSLFQKILRILYILGIVIGIYFILRLCKELNIKHFILVILKTIAPVFIGLFVAWLFDPIVKKLKRKGLKRGIGATITYVLFIGLLLAIVSLILPILADQINEFVKTIPSILDSIKEIINKLFENLNSIDGIDAVAIKNDIFAKVEEYGKSLTNSIPELTVKLVKTLISGIGTFAIGLIIGFYFLIGFDNASELIITLLPKQLQNDTRDLSNEINNSFRRFINGVIIDALFVFIITTIAFSVVGLRGSVLFGLFCGITNVIPYAGPYIGGAPAVIVGFSQSPITGILTLISIFVIQFLEGNLLQPVIMSKTTKLHPVSIITGLLIFGHFFGIIGMVISTPIIAAIKAIFNFFNEKYEIIGY